MTSKQDYDDVVNSTAEASSDDDKLTDSQRARIERNRQRALMIKQKRQQSRPYAVSTASREAKRTAVPKVIDTGAGFLLDEEDEDEGPSSTKRKVVQEPGAILNPGDMLICDECDKPFMDSYLHTQFSFMVCDQCRDAEDKHQLITKTEAKNTYLLKDADFDKRDPPLRFILRKNPQNPHWGDMKLFLHPQVSERALEVWGTEDALEEAREQRSVNREKLRETKYNKKVKALRQAVRSSMFKKDTSSHVHEYGEESYNEEEDVYTKTCTTCEHTMSYEKM